MVKETHLIGRGWINLSQQVLISKNLSTLESNISFLIELLDELPTRQDGVNSPGKINLIIHIIEMRIKKNLSNPTPNMQYNRTFKK